MDYEAGAGESRSPRTAWIGAITIAAIFASFLLAILARKQTHVPFVVVAPLNTVVELDGNKPRVLPNEPRRSSELVSYYFRIRPGEHEVTYRLGDGIVKRQSVQISNSEYPVIYTLLDDSLHEMKPRVR